MACSLIAISSDISLAWLAWIVIVVMVQFCAVAPGRSLVMDMFLAKRDSGDISPPSRLLRLLR
jgi:hypothetical protein